MIVPDAKCVVNGSKVNDVINALNPLLNMDIVIGNVSQPQIQYSGSSIQIVIPPGGATTNEELDIVDANNTPSTRWFVTTLSQGATPVNTGTPTNNSNPSTPSKNRNNLGGTSGGAAGTGGGRSGNRDQLNTGATSGVPLDTGGSNQNGNMLIDGGGAAGRPIAPATDEFGNAIGGTMGRPKFDNKTGKATYPTGKDYIAPGDPGFGDGVRPLDTGGTISGGAGAFGGGTDAFGNELYADGTRVTQGVGRPKAPPTGGRPKAPPTGGLPGASTRGDDMRGTPMSDEEYQAWKAAGSPPPTGGLPGSPPSRGGEADKPQAARSTAPRIAREEAKRMLESGQVLPTSGGKISLAGMTPEQMQAAGYNPEKFIPLTSSGQVDLPLLRGMVESGRASEYQKEYYNKIIQELERQKDANP